MPRNPSTGLFTRVSNSFSDPVVGTVIDQTDGISLFEDYDSGLTNTVAIGASQTISSGDKSQILTNLGATSVGKDLLAAVSAAAGRTTLGATTVGSDLFTAVSAAAGRTTLGATTVGSDLFTAANAGAARTTINAQAALGYTPANKAGDTFTGPTTVSAQLTAKAVVTADGTVASSQVISYGIGWTGVNKSWSQVLSGDESLAFAYYNYSTGAYVKTPLQMYASGNCIFSNNVNIIGAMSAGSKSFLIDHPTQPALKNLVFMATEGPQAGLNFWGVAKLVDGQAAVDLDAVSNLSAGTFVALTQRAFVDGLNNLDSFTQVRAGRIVDGKFTIYANDDSCDDEVAWHVVAERADPFIKTVGYCDAQTGTLIPEHDKA